MPLSAPPDRTRVYLCAGIAICILGTIFFLTRSNLPHVGDNIHSLPHGGRYRDGTKSVDYCSPRTRLPSSNLLTSGVSNFWVLALICVLIGFIKLSARTPSCQCGHCPTRA
ncbi:triple gene block protein 2 [Elderberry carlavirus B]|uniref:triple gene block protein 2 n=1 Tax=Elderberry carlavirus B TaxID=1569053 RepID=UPI00054A810B|nr:triple gene block protein 2 [Elderberry carlavirus B]AIZ76621.1 triple gene block protein 2 [Elderberry carlavirus B]